MVDELQSWPGKSVGRVFGAGRQSCHLTVSTEGTTWTPAEATAWLHSFAARIGLRREWFQPHPTAPHYDLTPKRRAAALLAGAVFVPARQQARARMAARQAAGNSLADTLAASAAKGGG